MLLCFSLALVSDYNNRCSKTPPGLLARPNSTEIWKLCWARYSPKQNGAITYLDRTTYTIPLTVLNCSTPRHSPTSVGFLFFLFVQSPSVWSTSWSVLHLRHTQLTVSSLSSKARLHSIKWIYASSSSVPYPSQHVLKKCRTFSAHSCSRLSSPLETKTKLFFKTSRAPVVWTYSNQIATKIIKKIELKILYLFYILKILLFSSFK